MIYHLHMGCCGDPAGSVTDLVQAALRRPRWRAPAASGRAEDASQNLRVEIHLETEDGFIRRMDYQCTTCASLIAYCEALVLRARGLGTEKAARICAGELIRTVRGVPACRQDRAELAVTALRRALSDETTPEERSRRE